MATVLKMTKTGTDTGSNTIPIRSATIFVDATGRVKLDSGSVIDMGFYGDNNVSEIVVKLWSGASIPATDYQPTLVFYHVSSGQKTTLSMEQLGNEYKLNIPSLITNKPGNYQIYFVLKERLNPSTPNNLSGVGVEDDPAYREVFISEPCKGVVDQASGRKYLETFDWSNGVYDYEWGMVKTYAITADGQTTYTTNITLSGLKDGVVDITTSGDKDKAKINVRSNKTAVTVQNASITGKILTIQGTAPANFNKDDGLVLEITYPVVFSASTDNIDSTPRKSAIVVNHNKRVGVSGNNRLGIKYDSYVTPINVANLLNVPRTNSTTNKYTIFEKNNVVYVCPTINNICWIPVGVTYNSGDWNVSFVGKNGDYTYYTNVISMPVVDNILELTDIDTDSNYQLLWSEKDTANLYAQNEAIYVLADDTPEGRAIINYSAGVIETAIGWVNGIVNYPVETLKSAGSMADALHAKWTDQELVSKIDKIDSLEDVDVDAINKNISDLQNEDTTIKGNIGDWNSADGNITTYVKQLRQDVNNINVSGDVSAIAVRVGDLEKAKDDYKAADTKLKQELQKEISDLNSTVTNAYKQADEKVKEELQGNITSAKTELEARIDAQGGSISGLSSSVQGNVREIAAIKAQLTDTIVPDLNTKVSSSTFQSEVGRLDGRIDKANENITLIKNDLNGEGNANSLQAQINTNKEDIQKAYQYIDDELKEATDAINNAIGTVDVEKDGSLATQVSTNSEQIKNISDNLGDLDSILGTSPKKSLSERLGNLSTLDDSVAVKLSNSIQEIGRVDSEVTAIKNSTSYIKNNGDEVKGYIQEIVFLRSMDEYNAISEKGRYTLYLIQEEGE